MQEIPDTLKRTKVNEAARKCNTPKFNFERFNPTNSFCIIAPLG
jgi:hypothetical protein